MSDTDMNLPEKGPGLPGHDDSRPDIEQAVQARSDAVAHGEGGTESDTFTAPGVEDGVGGTGGEVKRDTQDQQ
ncbi:hypothetical protein [Sphingomonas bacterium]|uniref:hypothetical protein n=1 Tax=Sphingomonas bacterium TaxID=1895847 RepID=UPI0015760896|nr:hypothetical protein [Sphingomonas bacterium]